MHGPRPEHVDSDPFQDDPRVVNTYNGMSPSGDVEADVVYANYGAPEDFDKLKQMNVDVRGKIVIVRYGQNFRGVKVFVAQERGAAGVIIYSDPKDDGYYRGDAYPKGPWRPASGTQRGSVGYMFQFPGDPTTPGIASVPSLPDSKRISPAESAQLSKIPVDAAFVCRRVSDSGASWRPRFAARMAGSVAVHLSRRPWAREGQDPPEAGLPVPHHLGCDRQSARNVVSR